MMVLNPKTPLDTSNDALLECPKITVFIWLAESRQIANEKASRWQETRLQTLEPQNDQSSQPLAIRSQMTQNERPEGHESMWELNWARSYPFAGLRITQSIRVGNFVAPGGTIWTEINSWSFGWHRQSSNNSRNPVKNLKTKVYS